MNRRATTIAAWRPATIAALAIWGFGMLLLVAGIVLLFLNRSTWGSPLAIFNDGFSYVLGALTFLTVGAWLFARFPRNAVAWIFCGLGLTVVDILFVDEYVIHALVVAPGSLPAATLVSYLSFPTILGFPFAVAMFVLLFPDGRPRSRFWSAIVIADIVLGALTLLWATVPGPLTRPHRLQGISLPLAWPDYLAPLVALGATNTWKAITGIIYLGNTVIVLTIVIGVLSLIWRLWHIRGPERQQLKWLVYVMAVMTLGVLGTRVGGTLGELCGAIGFGLLLVGIPVATVIAITKYRLYDIDLVINKTLVYGFLAIVITAIYALIVVYIGAVVGGPERFGLSLVATALIAIAFQPLRARAERVANRLVYGKRATPYEALSQLNEQIAGTYGGEELLDRMTRILAEATGAECAELWVRRGQELVRTSAWPAAQTASHPMADGHLPEIAADKVLPVTHNGRVLGALALTKKRGESLSPLEEKLLADLASQAGLVLENAGLNRELLARLEDLQASRQRLVTAQDEERRRIERNLHDGAQQQVVALTVQLGLLERMVAKDPEKAKTMAVDLRQSAAEALETLRELAHGIYPPLLASDGLAAALQQHARRLPLRVEIDARDLPRQPKELEAAVYFCCLEALQNTTKHAEGTSASIRLWADDGQLHFEVQDNGRGFDPAVAGKSLGLQNMRDRMQALGGTLEVRSRPGEGTCIIGSTPLHQVQDLPALSPTAVR